MVTIDYFYFFKLSKMALEQNNEQLSLYDEVDQELESLSSDEAKRLPLPTAHKKTEEDQESVEVEGSGNEFKKFADECAETNKNVKNDKKLPWILENINKLYSEKWLNLSYKSWFWQLIKDETSYDRSRYAKPGRSVVWFLQMTKDKFNNPDIKGGTKAFAEYQNGTRSAENIANDTASQMVAMVSELENHKEYNANTKSLELKPIKVSYWSLKFYQYCGASRKVNSKVSSVAWKNNIKYENDRLWLWLTSNSTWKQTIDAYDKWAKNNIS